MALQKAKHALPMGELARRSRDGCGAAATAFTPHQSAPLTASPQGEAFHPTIILQLTLLVSVNWRRLYRLKEKGP